jgi:hypothetical protein
MQDSSSRKPTLLVETAFGLIRFIIPGKIAGTNFQKET